MAKKKETLDVLGRTINILSEDMGDYVCLTDMVKGGKVPAGEYIRRWLRTGPTIEFLGEWESVHNENFNLVPENQIKSHYTDNAFVMSVKNGWKRVRSELKQLQGATVEPTPLLISRFTLPIGIAPGFMFIWSKIISD
jgi:hypothetical protein